MKKYIFGTLAGTCAVVLGLWLHNVMADQVATTRDQLDRYIKNAYFAVVMFNDEQDKKLDTMFQEVSETQDYKDSALAFVRVNTQEAQVEGRLKALNIDKLPAFVLYGKGDPIRDDEEQVVMLSGPASKKDLKNFIDDSLGGALEDIRSAIAEAKEEGKGAQDSATGVTVENYNYNENYYYDTPYMGWWWWPYYFAWWYPFWWGGGRYWWGGRGYGHYGYHGQGGWRGGRGGGNRRQNRREGRQNRRGSRANAGRSSARTTGASATTAAHAGAVTRRGGSTGMGSLSRSGRAG
ncbi:MAG TPA: hypothetical protein VEK38_04090, partial [Candidatus Bathyarchaeia archaeon]|nr:hypothetical protein [Candidatus Bathyarchaeia archaeon]